MALIVEDGSGMTDSESYCSEAEAATYHTKMGSADAWDEVEDKDAALRKATQYMLSVYRPLWAGSRLKYNQALDWPRIDVPIPDAAGGGLAYYPPFVANDIVPNEVKNACAELALKSVSTDLLADEDRKTERETVGPITVVYAKGGSRQTKFAAIDGMLMMLFGAGATTSIRVSRA